MIVPETNKRSNNADTTVLPPQKGRFGRSKKYQRKGRTGLAEKSKITKDGYDSVSHIGIPT